MAMLTVENINVYYGVIHALKDISFQVNEGEIVALIGANGAGKTTTLQTVSGMLSAKSGSIRFQDQEISRMPEHKIVKQGISHVPEGRRMFSNLTVLENLKMGAYTRKDKQEINNSLEMVYERFPRLKERTRQLAGTLSGGEQQRVAVARALAHGPKLVIADEPTGNIDPELSLEMMELLERVSETGITVVVVTHEHELVRQFHQRVVTLKKGRIISDVPADKEAIRARAERKERLFETELEPADTAEKEVATV